jgi:hypothetical protein
MQLKLFESPQEKKIKPKVTTQPRVLLLTLSRKPFEVMATGEKKIEFRDQKAWIESRLYDKEGNKRDYDYVKFINGYGKNRPFFIAAFKSFDISLGSYTETYSNGLKVNVRAGTFRIHLGKVLNKEEILDKLNKEI